MNGLAAVLLVGGLGAQLLVAEPPELAAALGSVEYSMSSFGVSLPFGRTLLAALRLPEPGNENGCVALPPFEDRFVYLLLRGKCSYSKKAFLSQIAGAAAVLVYHEDEAVRVGSVVPVSDTIYNNLQIPVLLVNNTVGRALAASARQGAQVRVSVTPQVGGRRVTAAELEFWFDPANTQSLDFVLAFERVLAALEGRATLHPKYKLESLPASRAAALCFGGGAYCVTERHSAGAESLLREVVRQVCLLNLSAEADHSLKAWFDYLRYFRRCLGESLARGEQSFNCFEPARQNSEIDAALLDRVEGCYQASFGNATDPRGSPNSVLAQHQHSILSTRYSILPAVFVNGALVKEDVELNVVVSAVCSDLEAPPAFCQDFFTQNIDWAQKQRKVFGAGKFVGLVLLSVFGASVVCIYCCVRMVARRRISSEIDQFVREHVNEYILENSLKAAGVASIEHKSLRAF